MVIQKSGRVFATLISAVIVGTTNAFAAATPTHPLAPPSMTLHTAEVIHGYLKTVGSSLTQLNPGLHDFASTLSVAIPTNVEKLPDEATRQRDIRLQALGAMAHFLPNQFVIQYKLARMGNRNPEIADKTNKMFLDAYELAGDQAVAEYHQRLSQILSKHAGNPQFALQAALDELTPYAFYGQKLDRRIAALRAIAKAAQAQAHAEEFARLLIAEEPFWVASDPPVHHGSAVFPGFAALSPSLNELHGLQSTQAQSQIDTLPAHTQGSLKKTTKINLLGLSDLAATTPFQDISENILRAILAMRPAVTDRLDVLSRASLNPSTQIQAFVHDLLQNELLLAKARSHIVSQIQAIIARMPNYAPTEARVEGQRRVSLLERLKP